MKNIAIFLLIVLSASSFSCDFLEEEPKGLISDTYAKTEEGVESLILSIYQRNRYLTERLYNSGKLLFVPYTKDFGRITQFWGNDLATVLYATFCSDMLSSHSFSKQR